MRSTGFGQEASRLFRADAIFDEHERPASRRRPLLTAVAGLAVVLAVVVLIAMTGDRYDAPTPARAAARGVARAALARRRA